MRQTPLAELGDGLLDVTVIPDISMWTIAKEVPRLFTGTFHKVGVLTMAKCREVLVLPDGEADAEPVEVGHEMVGIVEEVGSAVTHVKPGDRVTVNVETFCGGALR